MDPTDHPETKKSSFLYGALFGLLLVAVVLVTAPMVVRSRKKADGVQALNNARQIGLALLEFEQSYGNFPNDHTATEVIANTSSTLHLGSKYSNDYFRQLMAAELTQSEAMFYANIPNSRKPDNIFTDAQALEKGECGFSYLIGATKDSPLETPLAISPLVRGKKLFDPMRRFSGKAIILRKDGSVQFPPIDKSGRVWINGKDLFDPTQPFWNGKAPIVKWPDL